jgi:hypothetical protein
MRTKQVACDILPLRIYSLTPFPVPVAVVQATCEMTRELLIVDRTAAPPGEGIESV